MDDERQRQLAEELCNTLDEVILDESERRKAMDEIGSALALSGPDGARRLAQVLRARPETRIWMHDRDPDRFDVDRMVELAGPAIAVGTYLVCPYDDYDFVLESVGVDVPHCPNHHVPLVPVAE